MFITLERRMVSNILNLIGVAFIIFSTISALYINDSLYSIIMVIVFVLGIILYIMGTLD